MMHGPPDQDRIKFPATNAKVLAYNQHLLDALTIDVEDDTGTADSSPPFTARPYPHLHIEAALPPAEFEPLSFVAQARTTWERRVWDSFNQLASDLDVPLSRPVCF